MKSGSFENGGRHDQFTEDKESSSLFSTANFKPRPLRRSKLMTDKLRNGQIKTEKRDEK